MAVTRQGYIRIRGAREHNLKDISLDIPRDSLVVITGVSGSGKSSLAFDTIYAEGQRRYVESLSPYARQFLEQMDKPEVDSIEGLSPAVSIAQRSPSKNPRSTVGTVTEIYDYLRVLFAKVGQIFCPRCHLEISSQTVQEMVDRIMALPQDTRLYILSPILEAHDLEALFKKLRRDGFTRVKVGHEVLSLEEAALIESIDAKGISIVVDRLVLKANVRSRLTDSIELALSLSGGKLLVDVLGGEEMFFTQSPICPGCGYPSPRLSPQLFSFNNPKGACEACAGMGIRKAFGVMETTTGAQHVDLPTEQPDSIPCDECDGSRLRKEALNVRVGGKNIHEICSLSLREAREFFATLELPPSQTVIVKRVVKEIGERLDFLISVGVDYLTLSRATATLSGGEAQRIRLATQIGANLAGVLYVLDEPTIGLHQRDNLKLLQNLKRLRDLGNTVIVVEHDRETIMAADQVIDMGPGAGAQGGDVVFQGSPLQLLEDEQSITGKYLSGKAGVSPPGSRRQGSGRFLVIEGASEHNLKDISVKIPLGTFTCITGVSGSGKSTLIYEILFPYLSRLLYGTKIKVGRVKEIRGMENIDKVINIDQSPIGRTPRSNPATYTGVFSHIRALFSQLPEARARGYKPARFSFNVRGGRCEVCKGEGLIKVEMHFLPDIWVTCEACEGRRYNRDTLEVRYRGYNIAQILDMTVEESYSFFERIPHVRKILHTLLEVGLGYVRLGQPATTLSGGEAQRIKLSKELSKRASGATLYLMDEPTTGLHFADIEKLIQVVNSLVDMGNTVVVIEHNLDVIKWADYIIDLGPEGGMEGGYVVATGTPEEIAANGASHTGRFLKEHLP